MDFERFRQLLTVPGPFVSVYFEDSHDTQDAETQLELKWRALREELVKQGADESIADDLERAVLEARPPVGHSGRALIAGADGVVLNERLLRPTATAVVRVSELPYVVPLVELGFGQPNRLLVAVDHAGADITIDVNGTRRSETVDPGRHPVHKASGAETPGYGEPQSRTEEVKRKNVRAVADRVTSLADDAAPDAIFIGGEVQSRSDLLAELPERVRARTVSLPVGARRSGYDTDEVQQAIDAEFLKRRLAVIDDAAQRFTAETGRQSGLAVEELGAVCSALRQGAVETLIIGEVGDATVVADEDFTTVAPNADVLSKQGAPPARMLRADEALPLSAVSVGALLVRIDERLAPAEGIGALLRYTPPGQPVTNGGTRG